MNPRITLVVVALFALLFGYVYLVELNKTPTELGTPAPAVQPQVLSLTTSNVKSIQVRDLRSPRQVDLTRTDNGWQLTQPKSEPADTQQVDAEVQKLTNLQATRVLTNVTDLKSFGLVTATLEVRLVMSDTTPYGLIIGDKTPDGSNYYVTYTGDKSRVFIISSVALGDLATWLDSPPYQPTPTPTFTPSPTDTPTPEGTPAPATLEAGTPTP